MTLEQKAKEVRDLVDDLNKKLKGMEGDGCTIKVQCNKPYNKIDFIIIEKVIKL